MEDCPPKRWNDFALAASKMKSFYAFSRGTEEGGLCPKTSNWMDALAGSRKQDRGGTSKNIEKLTALIVL